jgi:hypothetical protein
MRLLAVTKLSQTIGIILRDNKRVNKSDAGVIQSLRDTTMDIIQEIHDQVETQDERDEIIKSAIQSIEETGYNLRFIMSDEHADKFLIPGNFQK